MKPQEKTFIVAGTTATLIAAGLGGSYLFFSKDNASATNNGTTTTSSTTTPNTSAASGSTAVTNATTNSTSTAATQAASSGYKDGTYSATTQYSGPRGYSNSIGVSVTVKDGIVTAVKTTQNYSDRESGMYIDSFENALRSAVVGKSLDGLQLNRIGGATLTTVAFDDAIASIQSEAKA